MKRYEKYIAIPSAVSPVMPEAWTAKKLKFVLSYSKGKQPSQLTEEPIGDPYATMDYLRGRDCILQYPVSTEGLVHIDNDSLLVLWDGANAGEFLRGKAGYLGSTMAVIKAGDNMDKSYLFYLLKGSEALSKMIAGGTTIPHFSPTFFDEVFAIPSLNEQQKIAAFLDYKTGKIDRLTEMLNARIENLKKYRQSMIHEATTHGLNKFVEFKPSGVDWIGDIPKHWHTSKIQYLTKNLDHLRQPISASDRERNNPLYDYYGASGVIDKIDHYNVDDTVLLIGEDGANLVGRNLPLIYKASGKFWVNNHAHILKPNYRSNYEYLYYVMETADYTHYITGALQPKLSQANLANVILPVPPISEQLDIAEYLDRKTKLVDETIKATEQQIKDLQAYRISLISEAVTGQIDVRDWTIPIE